MSQRPSGHRGRLAGWTSSYAQERSYKAFSFHILHSMALLHWHPVTEAQDGIVACTAAGLAYHQSANQQVFQMNIPRADRLRVSLESSSPVSNAMNK